MNNPIMKPTMHEPFALESKVRIKPGISEQIEDATGTIIGIASINIIFHYIILLDNAIETPEGTTRGVSIQGTHLENI